ncbi:phosphoadenosine phosphosulfate reductase family protein [Vibrio parahaemolyticus]|nr:phosphoadenosine phosphosulfate reductase family protein [Vibrio parahaemolyticus]
MNKASSDLYDDRIIVPGAQMTLFGIEPKDIIARQPAMPGVYFNAPDIELDYDIAVVCMSGGKDSLAALKYLLDRGFPASRIELWHHLVDGQETVESFMDWPFIDDYCVKLADALNMPLYFSWLKHGFKGEMLKNNSRSHSHMVGTPNGVVELTRDAAKEATRRKFPQQAASLQTRWCSSALKIDVGRRAVTCQERFIDKKVLFVTGERREESSNRAKYNQLEPHSTDTVRKSAKPLKPRHVDAWRPVLHLSEEEVWQMLCDWRINPPVPYRLGWGRSSCQTCIFNGDRIWATIAHYWPERALAISQYEEEFGMAISRNGKTVIERAAMAEPLEIADVLALRQSICKDYDLPIFVPDKQPWILPAGAYSGLSAGAN